MNCKGIEESHSYSSELIREVKAQSMRYFILLICITIVCGMLVAYIFYDRHMDSLVEVEATEITQDGEGYNNYIDGIGDIYNGSEDNEN